MRFVEEYSAVAQGSARHSRQSRGSNALGRAHARYGWRIYAAPVLVVLTIAALVGPAGRHVPKAQPKQQMAQAFAPAPAPPVTPKPTQLWQITDSTACEGNTAAAAVLVDISQQHAWMCEQARQVFTTPVTTGALKNDWQTPTGSWAVQGKQRDRYLVGPGYRDYVHYWVPFNGDFGFHDAPWQTMPYGAQGYRTNGSHGCVHLPATAMVWFYSWVTVGTKVTVTS